MRFPHPVLFLAALVASPFVSAAESATPEALRDAVKAAVEARSVSAWKANVACESLAEADKVVLDGTLTQFFASKPEVVSLDIGPLVDGFDPVLVGGGRKYTMTLTPTGVLNLKFRTGKRVSEIALPYGKVASGYKLGTLRGEKLDWKGPEDRAFTVTVKHPGAPEEISVLVKYNASGVDLEKRVSGRTPRMILPAQYIDSVELVRTGETKGDTTLEIFCQGSGDANDLKEVYKSEKLPKAGTITFRRKAAAAK